LTKRWLVKQLIELYEPIEGGYRWNGNSVVLSARKA
jgi:hypothetical protein